MKLLLIDGNSLLNRAFYAMPLLTAPDGRYTNAVYGFTNMLLTALEQVAPTHVAVAFDRREPTFRHREYQDYKAGRKEMPQELAQQFPLLREVLERMNISTIDLAGYEADDLIGTLSLICQDAGGECVILSGDKDNLQLVSDTVQVWITRKGISQTEKFTPEYLKQAMGLEPRQITDYKALAGDSSDNIPGVSSVGEKTALKLLARFGSVEEVLAHTDEIGGKLGLRIAQDKDNAVLSKRLATIDRHVPISFTMDDCKYVPADAAGLYSLFSTLQFKSLLSRIPEPEKKTVPQSAEAFEEPITHTVTDAAELDGQASDWGDTVAVLIAAEQEEPAVYMAGGVREQIKIPLGLNFACDGISPDTLYPALRVLLKGKRIITYDAKALMHELEFEFEPAGDIMVAEYLLNCIKGDYPLAELLEQYGASDGACAMLYIDRIQRGRLEEQGMTGLYNDIELPLIGVLYSMEVSGFTVDSDMLRRLGAELGEETEKLSRDIYELAGERFNINSTKQLGEILFEKLGLPHGRKTKTGYSTSVEVLQSLVNDHPIIKPIMDYRQLQKLKSTYIDGMLPLPDDSGRVHSSFNQTVTATGRISSAEPNLQNIPVRTELGRIIRKAFTAKEGCVLIDGDYSQIELRVLAHMSQDERLCGAFARNEDIHTATAASVFRTTPQQVTRQQRSAAKAVNFGIVYGISDYGLSQNLGVPVYVAGQYIKDYLEQYIGVREFMERCKAEAKLSGYAVTMMGRRRPCPELVSSNYNTRSFGERVAMNTPVQGSAADIIKLAMVRVHGELKKRNMRTRLILQVHDELILEAPLEEQTEAEQLLKECMEGCCELRVPLVTQCSSGLNWYDTK